MIFVLTEYLIDFRNDEICSLSFNMGTGFFKVKNLNENETMPNYDRTNEHGYLQQICYLRRAQFMQKKIKY